VVDAEGDTIVAVRRRGLTAEQKRELAIYDNRTAELAEWNLEQVRADIDAGLDLLPFFTDAELRDLFPAEGREAHASLSDRFGVPPFTVLDARQGYWQDRKRAWLDLGIESELGRGENGTACPGGSAMPGVRGPRKDYKPGQSKPFKFKNAVPVNASADRGPKKTRGTYNDRAWIQSKGLKGLAQNTHVTPAKRKAATTAAPR
jgi:hypothetical protein